MVHWTQMDVFFVVGNAYRLLLSPIDYGWQWPSMNRAHDLLWLAVIIDGHASCGGQHILIGHTTSQLLPTRSLIIDGFSPSSFVADSIYR